MRTARVFLSLALAELCLATSSCRHGESGWLDDPDQAFALAAETGRPLLAVFR